MAGMENRRGAIRGFGGAFWAKETSLKT